MTATAASDFCFTAYRRDARSVEQVRVGLLVAVALPVMVGFVFAALGAWPIAIAAALVSSTCAWAMIQCAMHESDYERVQIQGDRLFIESRTSGQHKTIEFNRYWARLEVSKGKAGCAPRLWVSSQGKQIEIGWLVTPERRIALAQNLREWVGAAYTYK